MQKIKEFFKTNYLRMIIAFTLGLIYIVVYNFVHKSWGYIVAYSDTCLYSGIVLLCVAGFSFINYHGAFDIFAYTFTARKRREQGEELYDYSERRRLERKVNKFVPLSYLLVSVVYLLVSIILFIIITAIYL